MIALNDYEAHMLMTEAGRYAIGRSTYAASETAAIIRAHVRELPTKTAFVIARDIRGYVGEMERTPKRLRANYDLDVKPYVDLLPALDARAEEAL